MTSALEKYGRLCGHPCCPHSFCYHLKTKKRVFHSDHSQVLYVNSEVWRDLEEASAAIHLYIKAARSNAGADVEPVCHSLPHPLGAELLQELQGSPEDQRDFST